VKPVEFPLLVLLAVIVIVVAVRFQHSSRWIDVLLLLAVGAAAGLLTLVLLSD
jgi:hypothetical protein